MSKRRTIWLATEGEYSDYRVLAAFTTKELAANEGQAEEFLLFDRKPRRVTVYSIGARIWPDGSVTSEHRDRTKPDLASKTVVEYGDYLGIPKPIMEARTFQAPYSGKDWLVRVSGTDKAKVMKSFQDRVAQARARTLGVS